MTYQEIIENLEPELDNAVQDFKGELMKIRSGRLSPAFVEDIEVDCFGQLLPLKQLGAITSNSLRGLVVQLWDKSYVEGVVGAIEQEGLGLSVRIDGNNVFLTAPPLTQEIRQEMIQLLNRKKEDVFQQVRRIRDKGWKDIQDGFTRGEIREDDKFKGKDKLDEATRKCREKMEKMTSDKETELKG